MAQQNADDDEAGTAIADPKRRGTHFLGSLSTHFVRSNAMNLHLPSRRALALAYSFTLPALVVGTPALSQQLNSATRGGLAGTVTDPTGAVVPNATVTIEGPQGSQTFKTDSLGRYNATGLTLGLYKITVEAPGFRKEVSNNNEVLVDHTSTADLHLTIGSAGDTVEVESSAVQIDVENTSLNTAITDRFYNAVPLPRAVSGAFYVAPGVVTGGGTGVSNPSIGGASGLENLYVADGVTITDQAFGGLGTYNRFYGSLGSGINLAFVKEVDIKTGAFEPKYGRADGGIVEIVTKAGANHFFGALSAYFQPQAFYASRYQLSQFNYLNTTPAQTLSQPNFDAALELGGYVPGLRDKLFFFGAFDPTFKQNIQNAFPGTPLAAHGPFHYNTTTTNYAVKGTWLPFSNTTVEASHYGDPSRRNSAPSTLSATNAASVASSYQYGTRNSVLRVNSAITPSFVLSAAYTYNYNRFNEEPTQNNYSISDRTNTPFVPYGFGGYEPTKNDDYGFQVEVDKRVHFLADHTFSLGYNYDHTNFLDQPSRSGPLFAIPGANADGTSLTSLYTNIPAGAIGKQTNATFYLRATKDQSCAYCPTNAAGQKVYLQQVRGTYNGLSVKAIGRYHVLWGNDSFNISKYVNVNAGLRWEQQRYGGTLLTYLWNDNWSPRLGINLDPFGDRKSKIFFNYARYQNVLPLDAAIRQLGNEQDDTTFFYAPASVNGVATLDKNGSVIPVFDAKHVLNGTTKDATSNFGAPNFSSSSGEGILPGTRMEYENEYVLGIERQVGNGSVVKVRYSDRRLGRVVEDNGSQSPEGSLVDANYNGGIANITASSDYFINEKEVTYTPAQFAAANGGKSPGQVTKATYIAPAPGCTYANDTSVANGDFFAHADGSPYNGACVTNAATDAGALGADGKPDGFANPVRRYQEFTVEFDRTFRNHWQGRVNYRFAKLYGNYEGFFRNDNGQSDPGISSLFDFTAGQIGLLGDQFKSGYLNTDRRHVGNALLSYTFGSDSPHFGRANGLTVGTFLHALTGNPLSNFASHPIYLNAGEVPVGGRGTKGTLPTTLQLDLHADYPVHFGEKRLLKFALDTFNVTNSQYQTGKNQNLDTSPGAANLDFGKPTAFQGPFNARGSVRFEF